MFYNKYLKYYKFVFDKKYLNNLDNNNLYYNENAIHYLLKNKHIKSLKTLNKFNKNLLTYYYNNDIEFFKNNLDKINWYDLSSNENAIEILKNNLNKINWDNLSSNKNAIEILKDNLDKICWNKLSYNKNAIELLIENIDKIDWNYITYNPNIFKLYYI